MLYNKFESSYSQEYELHNLVKDHQFDVGVPSVCSLYWLVNE